MAKYLKSKKTARKTPAQNNISTKTFGAEGLQKVRKNIHRQAALTLLTIALTFVIIFAMTSAWYTNVAQTSGLTFEAEAWGFKGTITMANENVLAAPGDEGILNLTVENDSDTVSAISVNVSKNGLAKEMKQRLFFYVDTRMSRNGENMERVYLNRYEGYTYNVFNNSQLTLTEQFSNAPVIKWEWVYDVLGYYVLGQPYVVDTVKNTTVVNEDGSTTETPTTVTVQEMDVKEYLRPVVYDFDEATTLINTEGENITVELDTVNGTTSPEEYLSVLSKTDGYEGTIDPEYDHAFDNYYAVDVDEEGYGVYAYLCNYSEIQTATKYDTKLGELAYRLAKNEELTEEEMEMLLHSVTLTLSAQKDDDTVVSVSTLGSLQEVIASDIANAIQLNSNITIVGGETITIPENKRIMLDLNGYTITNLDGAAIQAEPGSSLTLTNGTLTQDETVSSSATYGIRATGAEVVMSGMTISDFQHGIYVGDNANSNELDSRIHMVDCNISGDTCAVFVSGNGLLSGQKSRLIVEKSTLTSDNIVISGNGDTSGNGRWGTDIQIIDSTILGTRKDAGDAYGAGIYQPQRDSTLVVINSQVKGCNGITVKGGSARIVDSMVVGNNAYQEPSFEGSGFTNTGDAIYVETNYGYDIQLQISGKSVLTHTAPDSKSVHVFEADATNVAVEIESGTFDEWLPDAYLADDSVQSVVDGKIVVTVQEQ